MSAPCCNCIVLVESHALISFQQREVVEWSENFDPTGPDGLGSGIHTIHIFFNGIWVLGSLLDFLHCICL